MPAGTGASTGPHSPERGEDAKTRCLKTSAQLQRGRTHLSAERKVTSPVMLKCGSLQRGRTHLSAESSSAYSGEISAIELQRGRTHLSAERRRSKWSSEPHSQASTGPHSPERGEDPKGSQCCKAGTHFNGAALT